MRGCVICERKLMILFLSSIIFSSVAVLSRGLGQQYYSWDDDYREQYHALFYWNAYAYVGAYCVPNVGYFGFTHRGWGGGSVYTNPNAKWTHDVFPFSYKEGGYTYTRTFVDGMRVGHAVAGIGIFAGIK